MIVRELFSLLDIIPKKDILVVFSKLKIPQHPVFKRYVQKYGLKSLSYSKFIIYICYNKSELALLYKSIEKVLFVGGCGPGVGIAFNIIDACFCFALGNVVGGIVALISCFPIPGFKVFGKAASKVIKETLTKIRPTDLVVFTKLLYKRLKLIGWAETKSLIKIREAIENMIVSPHNPFVTETEKALCNILKHFPQSTKAIENVTKTATTKLLEITTRNITPREVTTFGKLLIP